MITADDDAEGYSHDDDDNDNDNRQHHPEEENPPLWLFNDRRRGGSVRAGLGHGGEVIFKPAPPPPIPRKPGSRQRRGMLRKPGTRRPRERGNRSIISIISTVAGENQLLSSPPLGEKTGYERRAPPQERVSVRFHCPADSCGDADDRCNSPPGGGGSSSLQPEPPLVPRRRSRGGRGKTFPPILPIRIRSTALGGVTVRGVKRRQGLISAAAIERAGRISSHRSLQKMP